MTTHKDIRALIEEIIRGAGSCNGERIEAATNEILGLLPVSPREEEIAKELRGWLPKAAAKLAAEAVMRLSTNAAMPALLPVSRGGEEDVRACAASLSAMLCGPLVEGRRRGNSRLVYDKSTRTIVPVKSPAPDKGGSQELRPVIVKARQTLAFFESVIKCGEPWTDACEKASKEIHPMLARLSEALSAIEALSVSPGMEDDKELRTLAEFVLRHTWPDRAKQYLYVETYGVIRFHPTILKVIPRTETVWDLPALPEKE